MELTESRTMTLLAQINFTTLLCLIVVGSNCKFLEKNPQVHLMITWEWPKKNPEFEEISTIFSLLYFIRPSYLQLGTNKYSVVSETDLKSSESWWNPKNTFLFYW